MLFKWLNRRSQRRSYNWQGFGGLGRITEASISEDPGAGKPHAMIRAGAAG